MTSWNVSSDVAVTKKSVHKIMLQGHQIRTSQGRQANVTRTSYGRHIVSWDVLLTSLGRPRDALECQF